MAPRKGLAKPATGGARGPVIPVIPLPYLRKKQATASSIPTLADVSPPAPESKPELAIPVPHSTDLTPSTQENGNIDSPVVNTVVSESPRDTADIDPKPVDTAQSANGDSTIDSLNTFSEEEAQTGASVETSAPASSEEGAFTPPSKADKQPELPIDPSTRPQTQKLIPSSTRPELPPPFYPANIDRSVFTPNMVPPPSFNRPPQYVHHHNISNGSIVFGGYPESNGNSPAPLSGGFVPPPMTVPNSFGNGYSHIDGHQHGHANSQQVAMHPTGHFDQGLPANTRPEAFASATMFNGSQGSSDIAVHPVNQYGPPTPRSLHGSHTSGTQDQDGKPTGPGNSALANGFRPGSGNDFHSYQAPYDATLNVQSPAPGGQFSRSTHHSAFPSQLDEYQHDIADLTSHLYRLWGTQDFTDCTLELRYTDLTRNDRSRPTRYTFPSQIRCHKAVISQSPVLNHLLQSQAYYQAPKDRITLDTDDEFLRPDCFHSAIQRLYMFPLLSESAMLNGSVDGPHLAGNKRERFLFAHGYTAAGHALKMRSVILAGIQVATALLGWDTLEDALTLALAGAIHRHTEYSLELDGSDHVRTEVEFKYGPAVKILMGAILEFITSCFPPEFIFDASVDDPAKWSRIPWTNLAQPSSNREPAIARSPTARHPHAGKRMSTIQFGDFAAAVPGRTDSPAQQTQYNAHLSRVLLNVPFDDLRAIMSVTIHDRSSAQARSQAFQKVVNEREARRKRAVEAVRSGMISLDDHKSGGQAGSAQGIRVRLSAQRHPLIAEKWDVLNWEESIVHSTGSTASYLVRKWVPQFSEQDTIPEPAGKPRESYPRRFDHGQSMV